MYYSAKTTRHRQNGLSYVPKRIPTLYFSKINFPKLRSQDKFINTYGRKLVEICHNSDLCFLNGRTTGDRLGKPTCYTFNGFSIVDYTLVNAQLYNRFLNFNVYNLDYFSSHCAISLNN